jgi:hypothetical protein
LEALWDRRSYGLRRKQKTPSKPNRRGFSGRVERKQ